VFCNCM